MNNYISVYIFWIMSCAAILVSEMEAAYGLLIMGYVEFKHVELRAVLGATKTPSLLPNRS